MRLPGTRKTMLLLGLPVGLAAGGALAYFQFMAPAAPAPAGVPDPGEGQHGPMLALDERVINLRSGGSYRYAKVGLTVEIRPDDAAFYALKGEPRHEAEKEIHATHESTVPLLLDALGTVVSGKTSNEITAKDGRAHLKEELLESMRHVLGEHEVLDVYFTDLVMQ